MDVVELHLRQSLAGHSLPGQSDPAAMLGRVLALLAVIVPMAALALAWWLT